MPKFALLLALVVVCATSACAVAATPVQTARSQLADLRVASAHRAGYDRDLFPTWSARPTLGPGCDTRDLILRRDGRGVRFGVRCRVVAGVWREPYGARTLRRSSDLDVDHVVPLALAWRSGAWRWSPARRRVFANDPSALLAADDGLNAQKGDSGPAEWVPPNRAFRVRYAVIFVGVLARYRLTVTPADRAALARLLR